MQMSDKSLRELFGLDGGEFLDTGMTLEEWIATRELKRIHASYVQQDGREKKRRMAYVIRLCIEGQRVRDIDRFGSAVVEWGVEAVMEGDWDDVERSIEWCEFEGIFGNGTEDEHRKEHYRSLWSGFSELLKDAIDTRPAGNGSA